MRPRILTKDWDDDFPGSAKKAWEAPRVERLELTELLVSSLERRDPALGRAARTIFERNKPIRC